MPNSWLRLRALIEEKHVDLAHAHLPSVGIVARLVAPVPVVYTEHNVAQSYRIPLRVANRATYWRNQRTIAVSKPVADSIARYPGPRPQVIPNGVITTVEPGEAAVRVLELAERPPQQALALDAEAEHGVDVLIAAFRVTRQV